MRPHMTRRTVKLGVIEFHENPALRERFYDVVDDLQAASCIVDVWLMDIATVLSEYGYALTITTDAPLPVPAWQKETAR